MNLSHQQKLATVAPLDRPVVVLAGPGSGKTTVLTHRLAWMVRAEEIDPSSILVVTFAAKMAKELIERAGKMNVTVPTANISTIHAFCFRALKSFGDKRTLAKDWVVLDTIKQYCASHNWNVTPSTVRWWIERAKQDGVLPAPGTLYAYYADHIEKRDVHHLVQCYLALKDRLDHEGSLTFPDMVNDLWWRIQNDKSALQELRAKYRYILVDEGQDTFALAVNILRKISPKRFYIVGDNDQLLYRYAGATPERNLYATAESGQVFFLEENRRSVPGIVSASQSLITNNYNSASSKYMKTLKAVRPATSTAPVILHTELTAEDEADWIARTIVEEELVPGQVFVCTRTNAQLAVIEQAMMKREIPYVVSGNGGFFKRRHTQIVVSYMRLAMDEKNDAAFEKIYNVASRWFTNFGGTYVPHRYLGTKFLQTVAGPNGYMSKVRQKAYDGRFARGAQDLVAFVDGLKRMIDNKSRAHVVLEEVISNCYLPHYMSESGITALDPGSDDNVYDDLQMLLRLADQKMPGEFIELVDKMIEFESSEEAQAKAVELSTIHRLKGRERDVVFAAGWSEGLLPHARSIGMYTPPPAQGDAPRPLPVPQESDVTDERCLAYVALTRARYQVYVSTIMEWNGKSLEPSRFVAELAVQVAI